MATLLGRVKAAVKQSADAGITMFGLPGNEGGNARYCDVFMEFVVAVYDDGNVYVGLNGDITASGILANDYPVKMCIAPETWTWKYQNNALVGGGIGAFTDTITVGTDQEFKWSFTCGEPGENEAGSGYVLAGDVTQFHASITEQEIGYMYISGTGSYEVDSPVYPSVFELSVPGFAQYLEYYPWASYKSLNSTMQFVSCDYNDGSLKHYKTDSWTDIKNTNNTGNAYYYNGTAWALSPKINYPE